MTSYNGQLVIAGIVVPGQPLEQGEPGYELLACGLESIQRRRDTVTSPWIRGDKEIASVQGALTYGFTINAVGGDSGLAEAIALSTEVISAVQQKSWTLQEVLDGHTETFACRAAITVQRAYDRQWLLNARTSVTATIPVRRV